MYNFLNVCFLVVLTEKTLIRIIFGKLKCNEREKHYTKEILQRKPGGKK